MTQLSKLEWKLGVETRKAEWRTKMIEKSLHAVGRGIFQMEEAKMMGPDDSTRADTHCQWVTVGHNKRVDRKNKASSNYSVNAFWDPSGKEMVERS